MSRYVYPTIQETPAIRDEAFIEVPSIPLKGHRIVGSIARLSSAGVRRRPLFLAPGNRMTKMFREKCVKIVRIQSERYEEADSSQKKENCDEWAVNARVHHHVRRIHTALDKCHEGQKCAGDEKTSSILT